MNYIKELKEIGKYLMEHADGIIGDTHNIKGCDIWIRFDPYEESPSVEITKGIITKEIK